MSTASSREAQRGSRLFWATGIILYLLPLFILAMNTPGGWTTSPVLMVVYGVVSLAIFGLVMRSGESAREVVVEKPVAQPSLELESMVEQQRRELDERAGRIDQLEKKVSDLSSEIRKLLQLEKEPTAPKPIKALNYDVDSWVEELPESSSQEVRTQYDAYILLQRCIQKAQSLSGAHQVGSEAPRFAELAFDHPPMDLRRLCDSLRDEMAAGVLLYSPPEKKLLFANNAIRAYTGHQSERFVRDFNHILGSSKGDWERVVGELDGSREGTLRVPLQSEEGKRLVFDACLGSVPSGPFRGMVIAILYRQ